MQEGKPQDLHEIYNFRDNNYKNFFREVIHRIKKKKFCFSTAIFLSSLLHLAIIGLLYLSQIPSSTPQEVLKERESKALRHAFTDVKGDIIDKEIIEKFSLEMTEDKIIKLIGEFNIHRLNLGEKQKVELYKKLLKSYFQLLKDKIQINPSIKENRRYTPVFIDDEGEFDLSSGDKVFSGEPLPGIEKPIFYVLPREKKERIEYFRRFEDLEKEFVDIFRDQVKVKIGAGFKYVPIEYYFRDSPYEEILARGADLFFVLKGFPLIEAKCAPNVYSWKKIDTLKSDEYNKDFVVIFLENISIKPERSLIKEEQRVKRVLQISDKEIEKILDDLMVLSEEEQFSYFIKNYLEKYDPNSGDLAKLAREFFYRNLNNVIILHVPISIAFSFVEELFYNKPLDSYIPIFWRKNPNTKTGAVLLLCLASLYDFEKRSLNCLFSTYEEAKKLLNKKYYKPNVFNKKLKAYIIKEIYDELFLELRKRGYMYLEDVMDKYTEEQKKIYNMVIRMDGEEKNMALFALGRLYWDEGDYDLALKQWKEIDNSFSSKTFKGIKSIFANNDNLQEMISEINNIFEYESSLNSNNQLKRLLKYHKWEKRGQLQRVRYKKVNK